VQVALRARHEQRALLAHVTEHQELAGEVGVGLQIDAHGVCLREHHVDGAIRIVEARQVVDRSLAGHHHRRLLLCKDQLRLQPLADVVVAASLVARADDDPLGARRHTQRQHSRHHP
jgi:hypothetical protein